MQSNPRCRNRPQACAPTAGETPARPSDQQLRRCDRNRRRAAARDRWGPPTDRLRIRDSTGRLERARPVSERAARRTAEAPAQPDVPSHSRTSGVMPATRHVLPSLSESPDRDDQAGPWPLHLPAERQSRSNRPSDGTRSPSAPRRGAHGSQGSGPWPVRPRSPISMSAFCAVRRVRGELVESRLRLAPSEARRSGPLRMLNTGPRSS